MKLAEMPLPGAFVVEIEPQSDDRGYFARTWCAHEFAGRDGLPTRFVQASLSHNNSRGTLRGMHTQRPSSREGKLVRCTGGRIYDIIVDLRPGSSAYLEHFGIELTAAPHQALYIPPAMLHGFQTLEDDTEVYYHRNLSPKCEPRLGKRGLYRPTGGKHPGEFEHAPLWVLNQSDGSQSLLDIAEKARLPFDVVAAAADALVGVDLLQQLERMGDQNS